MKSKIFSLFLVAACSTTTIPGIPPASPPPPPPPIHTMQMGLNSGANSYWANQRFTDAAHSFSGWFFWDSTNSGKTGTVIYGPTGYPLSDAQCISYMQDYPSGDYLLTWDGTATITIPWATKFVQTGTNSATVTFTNKGPALGASQLYMKVTGLNPINPFGNVHLFMPGMGPTSPMYRPEYLANLKSINVSQMRFMGDLDTSASSVTTWVARPIPSQWDWADMGIPFEAEIELAKEAGLTKIWVNIPVGATDDYVSQMANLFHSSLPAGIQVMVEFSNECWNWGGGFNCWPAMNLEANNVGGTTGHPALYDGNIVNNKVVPDSLDANGNPIMVTDQYTRAARAAADREYHTAVIWNGVYADRPQDLGMIKAGQAGWTAWTLDGLEWIAAKYGAPSTWFKYSAIAPYFDYNWNNGQYKPTAGWQTIQDLLTAATTNVTNDVPTWIDAHKAIANQYGLQLVDYEGGQSFYPLTNPFNATTDLAVLAQRDPGMTVLQNLYFNILEKHGVNIHFEFSYYGGLYGISGFWDILQNINDTQAPRWTALKNYSLGL